MAAKLNAGPTTGSEKEHALNISWINKEFFLKCKPKAFKSYTTVKMFISNEFKTQNKFLCIKSLTVYHLLSIFSIDLDDSSYDKK